MPGIAAGRRLRRWCASMVINLALCAPLGSAAPLERRQIDHRQESDDSSHDSDPPLSSNISPQIWVPAVVVVLVLLGAFCFVWTRTSVISRLRGAAARAIRPSSSSTTPSTREVTASQLTGGATVGRRAGTGTARRPIRRNRRTPSQISTTSLPAYMKEPGDHELVIFSGPEAMDASDAIAEAREAEEAEHDGRDSESLHRQDSRASMLMLDTNPTSGSGPSPGLGLGPDQSAMSLGVSIADNNGGENEPDTSTTQLLPRGHLHNSSRDTTDSSPLLMRRSSEVPSEAPPDYDYTTRSVQRDSTSSAAIDPPGLMDSSQTSVSVESDPRSVSPMSSISPQTQPATPEPPRATGRRSRLASRVSNLLHLRNGSNASNSTSVREAGLPGSDERGRVSDAASESAAISLNEVSPPSPIPVLHAQQQGRHRHSSSSTSTLALPFRTLSRQRSINSLARQRSLSTLNPSASRSNPNLASPSLLSLSLAAGASPIGSPIPHTLVRTEIRYPASGPTPEQVKLLSARDGPGRFGVPYGEEAVAYARSSRLELQERESEPPPPVFERSPAGESSSGGSAANGSAAGASEERRRSESVERGDEDGGDDPDALSEEFVSASGNGLSPAHSREGSSPSRNPSTENVAMDTRIILPLFY